MATKVQDQVKRWHDRISTSKRWKDSICEAAGWERFISEFEGNYDVVLGNIHVPPINEVWAYVQATKANLFFRNPYITVNAKKTGSILGAAIIEAAINYLWRHLKIKQEVELEIIDTELVGHGINKVGNNVKTTGSGNELRIESEKLFANRVSWRDLLWNVGTKRAGVDSHWMTQRIWKPTEDVKKEYGAAASKLVGSAYPSADDKWTKGTIYKDDLNYSAIWEIWDARDRQILTLADENSEKYLADPRPWPEYLSEFPFQILSFNEIPDKPYPLSGIAPWEPQILETIKIFTQALNHMKRWNRQMLIKNGTMDDAAKDKYSKGIDGSVLDVTGDPQTMAKAIDYGSLPPEIYGILDRLDAIKRSVNGQPEFERGGTLRTSSRTKGELELIEAGASNRTDLKLDRIETHCENIARQLIAHMQNHFDLDQVVRITGNEPQDIIDAFGDRFDVASQSIKFNKKDIVGEYDIEVRAGSTLPLDKKTRDSILDRVIELSVPLASAPSIPPFLTEVIKERLKAYDIKGLEEAFDRQSQAMAQAAEAKSGEVDADTQKTLAEAKKREAQSTQITVDTAITGAEAMAKATDVFEPEELAVGSE